ncbi:COP1-interacting protein 7 [Mercurialis annua]|uniref:COP1-interacting protein 7 n=1 Tax=Mercurialis annua TaxID=3986 RepID=UPI00215F76EC|nr:COP1-interacting protein 7 [Mercurialis annua]
MGSSTLLDYALFQLTPTRTRCDLVLFYGGKTEKLATGLFEPFISHLKFAQDQISKGGYSIKLCPPNGYAPWFTKPTFERFVRFVSTPAVLERFVNLEKEILQIESSTQANESSKTKGEAEGSDSALQEGNSKIQLQRLLETRKTLLRKEQAMAYARGLVAGFDMDNIDDLISFADEFGASRLREACINFKELCKKKRGDGLWMEELAAMEACPPAELSFLGTSGIVLNNAVSTLNPNIALNFHKGGSADFASNGSVDASTSDSTASHASSDGKKDDNSATTKMQAPMSWPNQMPQYMYNFPPYQGYPYPPPHYAMNMQWPPGFNEYGLVKKEKSPNRKGSEHSGEDGQTESSNSEVESGSDSNTLQDRRRSKDSSHRKKHKKKSSKTVVIRNINYITPKRRNGEKGKDSDESSDEEDFVDEDSLRQQVDDVIGSLEQSHKSNSSSRKKKGSRKSNGSNDAIPAEGGKATENWDAFQNLLMRDEESTVNEVENLNPMDALGGSGDGTALAIVPVLDLESETVPKQRMVAGDSFIVTQRDGGSEERNRLEGIENAESIRSIVKRSDYTDGDLVIPQRMDDLGSGLRGILETDSRIIKPGKGEDWFVVNHAEQPENQNSSDDIIFSGDSLNVEKNRKELFIDDSFMVHTRPVDDLYESQWKVDISMDDDLILSSQLESSTVKDSQEPLSSHEPSDLCMVLERESGFESARDSWNTDHGIDISFMENDLRSSTNGSNTNSNADKKLTANCDSNIAKKEETKGKRIPGKDLRSKVLPPNNKTDMLSKSRKPSITSRPLIPKSKQEKEEEIRKRMEEVSLQRQKRIAERTAAASLAPTATKRIPPERKQDKNKTLSTTQQTNKVSSIKIRAA